MSKNEINLFDEIEKKSTESLFVLYNNSIAKLSLGEIFDATRFKTLRAVSYVASPKFFADTVRNFESVILILGIDNVDNLNKFTDGLTAQINSADQINFFNQLPDTAKNLVVSNNIQIRYGKPGVMIHDKIYLLANESADDYRVITGSANFSSAAFNPDNQNFENIRVDDSKSLYQIYADRFNYLLTFTSEYIPEICRRNFRDKKVILDASSETDLNLLLDKIQSHNFTLKIHQQQIDALNQRQILLDNERDQLAITKKVVEIIIDKKSPDGSFKVKPLDFILGKKNALRDIFHKITRRKGNDPDFRDVLLMQGDYNIYKKSANETAELYSQPRDTAQIKATLQKINLFTKAYLDFAVSPNPIIPAKICDKSSVADIPMFCILSGTRHSGKTTALQFAATLLGQRGRQIYDYSRELDKAGVIYSLITENNLMPIFVDEISLNFFKRSNSPQKGEEMIKSLANKIPGEPHGTLIGTTNLSDFSTTGQVIRRIYYLEVSNTFDAKHKRKSAEYLRHIYDGLSDELFSDFAFKFARAINDGENFYEIDDFLALSRRIFLAYYEKCSVDIPDYFPRQIFGDYENHKVEAWRKLFFANRNCFLDKGDFIQVNIDEIFRNSTNAKAQKDRLINFIDEACVDSDFGVGVNWFLRKNEFYRFIDYKPSFVETLKNSVRNIWN